MSILAEPRRKQRISIDPQNVAWKNSTDSVGKKLMSKMNWKEGKGLGKQEQGSSDNLKLDPNYSRKGLGSDHATKTKNQWVSHHDEFASLLANLNSSNKSSSADSKPSTESIQSRSKNSKSRMHYKFTRGKDLSLATHEHKQGIFGAVKKEIQKEPEIKKESSTEPEVETNAAQMTFSTMSSSDYYKDKMKKWTSKKSTSIKQEDVVEVVENDQVDQVDEIVEKPKSKKRQRLDDQKKVSKKSKKFLN